MSLLWACYEVFMKHIKLDNLKVGDLLVYRDDSLETLDIVTKIEEGMAHVKTLTSNHPSFVGEEGSFGLDYNFHYTKFIPEEQETP